MRMHGLDQTLCERHLLPHNSTSDHRPQALANTPSLLFLQCLNGVLIVTELNENFVCATDRKLATLHLVIQSNSLIKGHQNNRVL